MSDDAQDFYGRQYYETLLVQRYNYPTLEQRARDDLPERCLHWLKATLKYKIPPGRCLELGSAHGGFVALLRWAGFDATGLELSSSIVEFARKAFGIPMLQGRIEERSLQRRSFDLIAAMDVLEHLPDPSATIRHCAELLKEDGIFLIQTPRYPESVTFEQLKSRNDPFLAQLKPEQHLFLFSESSLRRFFESLGLSHVEFLPAIFAHYDMFAMASATPAEIRPENEIRNSLAIAPNGRLVEALLVLQQRNEEVTAKYASSEADRAARLQVIEQQGAELGRVEAERNILRAQLGDLRGHFEACEADRAARLQVIEQQGAELGRMEAERNNLRAQLEDLRSDFEASEADRAGQLRVIEQLGAEHNELLRRIDRLTAAIADLKRRQYQISRIKATLVYRLVRMFGGWKWLDGAPVYEPLEKT